MKQAYARPNIDKGDSRVSWHLYAFPLLIGLGAFIATIAIDLVLGIDNRQSSTPMYSRVYLRTCSRSSWSAIMNGCDRQILKNCGSLLRSITTFAMR